MNIIDDLNCSGIYFIKHRDTGRVYVGCSSGVGLRIDQHIRDLRRGAHHNADLQADFIGYGETAFDVGMIQEVDDRRTRLLAEQTFIRAFKAADIDLYNTTPATTRYAKIDQPLLDRLTYLELSI